MKYQQLREEVCQANLDLVRRGLVILTWGNASGADLDREVMAIKPSGVAYDRLTPADIVVLDIKSGEVVEGEGRPSSDTPTHLELYRAFPEIGGVVHTHSTHATAWAQANRPLPCFGTTHADHFCGEVPLAPVLSVDEVSQDYERNTGLVIVQCLKEKTLAPLDMPAVLVPHHGPFTWGQNVSKACQHALILEATAQMASLSLALQPGLGAIPDYLLNKHYQRKHGPDAYYGQK